MSRAASGDGDRRLGVLGTLVLDTIRRPGAPPVRAPGGITYALSAFEARPPGGWSVVPLMKVGEDAADAAADLLDRLGTVASREGVLTVPDPNNRVELVYDGEGERIERLTGGVPGWSWEELAPLVESCDALYVNLIAGWEVDLAVARRLRDGFRGPLYCDLHSLFLGTGTDGERERRVPEGWRSWFGCFDYVQINRAELGALSAEAQAGPRALAERLAASGPRALFVTLGADGAAWVAAGAGAERRPNPGARGAARAEENGDGAVRGRTPPPRRVEDGDPTGCGDVWGMGCFAALLGGAGLREAVRRANGLAARNAARSGGLGLLEPEASAGAGREGTEPGGPEGG